jgi:transposase
MAKTPIAGLLRIGWDSVGKVVARVMADHLDQRRLDGLVAIGVDEISYRRGPALPDVCGRPPQLGDRVVRPGPQQRHLAGLLRRARRPQRSIRAVSIDMSGEYQRAIRQAVPHAEVCFDPFHVCRLAARATDQVRRDEWHAHERSHTPTGRWVEGTRWSLLKAPERQTLGQLATLGQVQQANTRLYRALLLREELTLLYHLPDARLAPAHLDAWIAWASRSRLAPFVALARTLGAHRDGILTAIRRGLSNGRLEGLNSKIRLISHRSLGSHSAAALIALVYLCCSGVVIELPR